MNHTPAPWHLGYNKHDASIHNGVTIASVCDDATHWKANARLIASAPELLAACESVVNDCDAILGGDDMSGMSDEELFSAIRRALTSAIVKAKGGAL